MIGAGNARDFAHCDSGFSLQALQGGTAALGYSSLWAAKYPDAFNAYARALALEPKHRGANSYLDVANVRTHDLSKARAQLAKLDAICGNKACDAYKWLDKAIAEYKPK